MKPLWFIFLFLQVFVNLEFSWSQAVNTCEIGVVLHPHLYIAGIPLNGEAITAGHKLHFVCRADHELDGATQIECLKTGQWSAPFPTCSAIGCTVPQIEHGSVPTGPREYKENEVLNFSCDATYKRADDRPPRCTIFAGKADWNPTPACRQITCELILPPPTGTTYDPPNKNVFLPGEMLRVLCGEKHWILDAQTRESNVTCNYNGVWNARTECQEVKCPAYIEEDNLYYRVNAWGRNKLGDRVTYDCSWGYQTATADKTATCTREGWTPKPLCRAKQCQRPEIVNSRITVNDKRKYGNGEQLTYECLEGNPNSVTITCERGAWEGIRPCPAPIVCSAPPPLEE
ncbi:complement factor H-like [Fundulus heteroclitus]|uniref:complement factor H-like n=1 Tax=Fundulus heteroclitus TaxID=8078 RepID=UPI00165ACF25|nr:complement factor H-like [Fundulus heteroclitus]XP_035996905.1 complement factor H-like [Fundulus heteroclitus]